ncbi:MAG: hypothetical protein ABSF90_09160 [Syntrophobacteraceae bacterium]|jgi:hypothetical protein
MKNRDARTSIRDDSGLLAARIAMDTGSRCIICDGQPSTFGSYRLKPWVAASLGLNPAGLILSYGLCESCINHPEIFEMLDEKIMEELRQLKNLGSYPVFFNQGNGIVRVRKVRHVMSVYN